jgi:3-oxoadipate CoA-transferase alpha subunit
VINKVVSSAADALSVLSDGASVMVGGFGLAGQPSELIHALLDHGAKDLVVISNNAGNGNNGLAALLKAGRVRKVVCSFPRQTDSWVFDELYLAGKIDLELVPQGNLAERIRAGGAGIPAFYSPTGYGTEIAKDLETREFNGIHTILQMGMTADVALISAQISDTWGNLVYRKTSRNFGPIMATAAHTTIVQVNSVVEVGAISPENVVTPGIYVDRIVEVLEDGATR